MKESFDSIFLPQAVKHLSPSFTYTSVKAPG